MSRSVSPPSDYCVAALYRFAAIGDCAALRQRIAQICEINGIKGTLLLAPEGINGTIAGDDDGISAVIAELRALPGFAGLDVKLSRAATPPFRRLKVRIKREIVTMGQPSIDATAAGTYVDAGDWNRLLDDPGTVIIDTRNNYEIEIGSFPGAINPGTRNFSDFPAWFRSCRDALLAGRPAPRVAMFCTGGIRCEKATAFLKAEGIDSVFHLEGGILKYLETVPAASSRWQGECFVFDERVAVGQDLAPGSHTLCRACRMPVGAEARAAGDYVEGVSCPACHDARNDTQRSGYSERHRQAKLAEARGETHIGPRRP